MDSVLIAPEAVAEAHERLQPHIHHTPLLNSSLLDRWLGHHLLFKAESFQKVGAFKLRGALNAMIAAKEQGALPDQVVAFSSGNHAQAVAYAAQYLGIKAKIFMPRFVSAVKQQATRGYGAEVVLTDTRQQAEAAVAEAVAAGAHLVHPYDDETVIAGQGTACFEALNDLQAELPDAVFAACGGGGLLSGSWLATQYLAPEVKVIGAEPALANDAHQSLEKGQIVRLPDTPKTIADGARTLAIAPRTFAHLKQLSGFYEAEEKEIIYWTQWLTHMLKTPVEPTCAVAMVAAVKWLKEQHAPKRVVVILSGGNLDAAARQAIWQNDYLTIRPSLTPII